jgi:hypothetical protein
MFHHGTDKELMMERWIRRWETKWGLAPRLSEFFSTPDAHTVLRDFKSCANSAEGDVEILAFLLIIYVWPEQGRTRRPSPQALKHIARSLKACSRSLATLAGTGLLSVPETVRQTCDQLQQWAAHLTLEARGWPMTPIGSLWIGSMPPAAKRHRAKRQVISFLTYYFQTLGCTESWRLITRFLILANLAPATAKHKNISTWWSNVQQREKRRAGTEPLAPFQESQLLLFQHFKELVWGGSP